ncbi:hypothetical protein [Streptomyces griseoruber]|uniref:hypothetical protein n=1 Tax=Streptomyces griseoruber TaxID=1943 RepID=UPI0012FF1F28|nr:hypothetical protein [Streptomyces griseoruber]
MDPRRLRTLDVLGFDGAHHRLSGTRLPRPVAGHGGIRNIPGPPHHSVGSVAERARILDARCTDLGRAPRPATITSCSACRAPTRGAWHGGRPTRSPPG